jgi:hypothetical protein
MQANKKERFKINKTAIERLGEFDEQIGSLIEAAISAGEGTYADNIPMKDLR